MSVDLKKMKAAKAERDAVKLHGSRRADDSIWLDKVKRLRTENAQLASRLAAHRKAIGQILAMLFFHGNHVIECPWNDGEGCNCVISRKPRKILARLRHRTKGA